MYRQGDVLLVESGRFITKRSQMVRDNIFIQGEITGHAHKIINGEVYNFWGRIFVKANPNCRRIHDEHESIDIKKGFYRVIRQQEYNPKVGDWRNFDGEYLFNGQWVED